MERNPRVNRVNANSVHYFMGIATTTDTASGTGTNSNSTGTTGSCA